MVLSEKWIKLVPLILICIIVLYGTLARLSVLTNTVVDHPIRADAQQYFLYAKNLSLFSTYSLDRTPENGLEKSAMRTPGFPYFASLFFQGENFKSVNNVLLAQTIVQCVVFIMLAFLCWQIYGPWSSVLISFMIWTHPAFMSINTYYLTESLFMSSIVIFIAFFVVSKKNQFHWILMIFFGVAIGLSALIRPTMEYYCYFITLLLLWRFRQNIKIFVPTLVGFLAVVLLWKIRNYFAIGSFSDPQLMINGLFHGSYPNFMYNDMPESYGFPYRFDPLINQYYEGVGKTLELIWQRVIVQPMQYLYWYLAGKQLFLWQWNIIAGYGDVFIYPIKRSPIIYQADLRFWHNFHQAINVFIMTSGVLFSYFLVIKTMIKRLPLDTTFLLTSLVVYASLFHIIVAPFPRYGIPFKLLVIIVSVLFVKSFFMMIKKRVKR